MLSEIWHRKSYVNVLSTYSKTFSDSNTDGPFTVAESKSVFSLSEFFQTAQNYKYIG